MKKHPLIMVTTDMHGRYHLNIGEHQYMYATPSQLAAGIAYHTQIKSDGIDTGQLNMLFDYITNANETAEKCFKKITAMSDTISKLRESNTEKTKLIHDLRSKLRNKNKKL